MSFKCLLQLLPIANMVAAAIEAWVVQDPILQGDTWQAQDQLAIVIDVQFSRPAYKPFWVRNPIIAGCCIGFLHCSVSLM